MHCLFIPLLLAAAPADLVPAAPDPKGFELPAIKAKNQELHVGVEFTRESSRFGVVCNKLRDPINTEERKKLTRDQRGMTNNTVFRVDGYEYLFGHEIPGVRWVRDQNKLMREATIPGVATDRGWRSIMFDENHKFQIEQQVEIVPGEQTLLYDTVLVRYLLTNKSEKDTHKVGLRFMLDSYIGANDGLPFLVPPVGKEPAHFVDTMKVFTGKDLPTHLRVFESDKLADPETTVIELGPKLRRHEAPDRLVLCRWPQNSEARWGGTGRAGDWKFEPMNVNPKVKDSCLVLYWDEKELKPGEQRVLGFTYGLGLLAKADPDEVIADGSGLQMRLLAHDASMQRPFTILAHVNTKAAKENAVQKFKLELPEGLNFAEGDKAEKEQGVLPHNQVGWRLQAAKPGTYTVKVTLEGVGTAMQKVHVHEQSRFD